MSSGGSRAPPGGVVGHAPRATDSAETVAKHDECLLQVSYSSWFISANVAVMLRVGIL